MLADQNPEVIALVNAAGFGRFGEFENITLSDQMGMIDLNVAADEGVNDRLFSGIFVLEVVHIDWSVDLEILFAASVEFELDLLSLAGGDEVFLLGNVGVIAFVENFIRMIVVEDGGRIVVNDFAIDVKFIFDTGDFSHNGT